MKQIIQYLKNGKVDLIDVPTPSLRPGHILISSKYSLISSGTEKMLINFGKANIFDKARSQPDKVKQVFNKIKTDGFHSTYKSVQSKLNEPISLGYCNTGVVIESSVKEFKVGDRVVSNGSHAEVVCVPKNLCAKIPDNVADEESTFTVVSSIGLNGVRLLKPTLGETIVVFGLGLIGLLTCQILLNSGCNVIGIDPDENKCEIAKKYGIKVINNFSNVDTVNLVINLTENIGCDGVIITASSSSNEIITQSAKMSRKKGRIVLIGVVDLNLSRDEFYKKELSFQVSSSYGPGRYDHEYEDNGIDYPIAYTRWTEQRNFKAILDMFSKKKIDIIDLISNKYLFYDALKAYDLLIDNSNKPIGILLKYPENKLNLSLKKDKLIEDYTNDSNIKNSKNEFSFIGAGNYVKNMLLPAFIKSGAHPKFIVSSKGLSAALIAKKFKFDQAISNHNLIFENKNQNSVVVATQHDTHAEFVLKALKNNKHLFIEKPLCINRNEFNLIKTQYKKLQEEKKEIPKIMIGFNRRFSFFTEQIKKFINLNNNQPLSFNYTINAGHLPENHWTKLKTKGGGRLIGEVCHFIDLMLFINNSSIESSNIISLPKAEDTISLQLKFVNGSIGTINYFCNGNDTISKERLEIYTNQKIIQLDNFKKIKFHGNTELKNTSQWKQDKGQEKCVKEFVNSVIYKKPSPISIEDIFEVSKITLDLSEML